MGRRGRRKRDQAARAVSDERNRDHRHTGIEGAGIAQRNQRAAEHGADQDRHERAHFHHAVAADQLGLGQMLRQVGILHRAEQRGVQAHHEERGEERPEPVCD